MRLADVALLAPSLEDQRVFYSRVLGLPAEQAGDDALVLDCGRSVLRFHPGEGSYHVAFGVPGNRFAEAREWLAERTDLLTEDGSDRFAFSDWDGEACYTLDPAGNVIELIALHGLDDADTFTGGAGLTCIAELGLPVPDVLATAAELERAAGISTWDGDPPAAGFSAIGARGASFIVVPTGRNWYPTDRPNVVSPVTVRIEADRDAVVEPDGTPYRLEFTQTA
jgi:catechol 2,3-dioxygenase-like lactoylglutathione lyase family enzyme